MCAKLMIGSSKVLKLFLGTTTVLKIFLGNTLIYPEAETRVESPSWLEVMGNVEATNNHINVTETTGDYTLKYIDGNGKVLTNITEIPK